MAEESPRNGGSRPVPDPTVLTTQQIESAISSLRELLEALIKANAQRIDFLQKEVEGVPELVSAGINHLKDLHGEKFSGIQTQFSERDIRVENTARESGKALDAALATQKEAASEQNKSNTQAIEKSEKATAERIGQQEQLFRSTTAAQDARINDIKEDNTKVSNRVTVIESRGAGYSSAWGFLVAGIGVVVAVGGIVLAVIR